MSNRGYLWENLEQEIEVEFAQPHPLDPNLLITYATVDYGFGEVNDGWMVDDWTAHKPPKIPKPKPVKPPRALKGRENWRSVTESVRDLRARRKAGGLCIDCGLLMDLDSKNYCPRHREKDRLRAEAKRRERGMREKLQDTRIGTTLHFTILTREENEKGEASVREVDGYLQTGEYADGRLGEVFIKVGKAGSSEALLDQWAMMASMALQLGGTVDMLFGKHEHTKFEPSGAVKGVPGIDRCSSPLDLISRWVIKKYGNKEQAVTDGQATT